MGKSEKSAYPDIDEAIRQGRGQDAGKALLRATRAKVEREHRLELAALARRAGLFTLGLKLLGPLVRPSAKAPATATPQESAEYAATLSKIGAHDEAVEILRGISADEVPEALLFESFALFTHWDYEIAIPLLRRYIQSPLLNDYQKLVGQVNLAAACVFTRRDSECEQILGYLRAETKSRGLTLLHGNSLELSAQSVLLQDRWKDAGHFLEEAQRALEATGSREAFYVRKWQAILEYRESGGKRREDFDKIRKEAFEMGSSETVRECDRFEALTTLNQTLFQRLYFGTPFVAYRRRLKQELPKLELGDAFDWRMGPEGKGQQIDHYRISGPRSLRPQIYKLLNALTSDFYRPIRLATLHAALNPGEYYHPIATPLKVHQAIKRARDWFADRKLPLRVDFENGFYRLRANSPLVIRLWESEAPTEKPKALGDLKSRFGVETFTAAQAEDVSKLPRRTLQRLLQEACRSGELTRSGKGVATCYRFSS